jgi:hypothetical protein
MAGDARAAHVGFYLFDDGREQLEEAAQARLSAAQTVRRTARRFPLALYLSAIVLITATAHRRA